jgi:transcriptional regulator with XRE-family HTH domain
MEERHKHIFVGIGKKLRKLRKDQKLSQQALANKCERIDRAKISTIETAKEDFTFTTLLQIAEGLGIDVRELLDF